MNQRNNNQPSTAQRIIQLPATSNQNSSFNTFKSHLLVALCAMALIVMSSPGAQAEVDEDAIFEVSLGGGLAIPTGDFSDLWDSLGAESGFELDFSGGYFLTQNISIGLAFELAQFTIDNPQNEQHYRLYTLGMYGKYFSGLDSKISPYLRVQGGVSIPNFSAPLEMSPGHSFHESEFGLAFDGLIGLGARLSTSENGGIFLEAAYRLTSTGGSTADFNGEPLELPSDVSHIQLTLGFGFDFGPKQ